MKISTNKQELINLEACKEGLEVFVQAHGDKEATFSQCLDSNGWDDVWWLIENIYNKLDDRQIYDLRVFGCKAALINIEKIKPYCPESDYELIVGYLKNPTAETRSAAWTAAYSAAESGVESAAWSAARSAAWTAAYSAAESGVESAAGSAEMDKFKKELKVIFLKWENRSEIKESK